MIQKPKQSYWDYFIILLVFAATGSTAALLPKYFMPYTGLENGTFIYVLVYILLITPIYQVLLLAYAFIFGKFSYFYSKQKQLYRWLIGRKTKRNEACE